MTRVKSSLGWVVALNSCTAWRMADTRAGGPADQAGIRKGDLIVAFAGQSVESIDALHRMLRSAVAEQGVPIELLRGNRKIAVVVQPAAA